jgi:hypothetical protein
MSYQIDVSELHDFLFNAMQLEHATIPPYLTALYSLQPGTNPDATQILRAIAVEEMLHLTLAANVMNAVGGKVDLTVAGFLPRYPLYLPDGESDFTVSRRAFSADTLKTFLQIERPSVAVNAAPRMLRDARAGNASALGRHPRRPELKFYSIGDFYKYIQDLIQKLEAEAAAEGTTIFTGNREWQVTPEYYYSGGGEITAVHSLETALKALELIIEQGEGMAHGIFDSDGEISHYYRFEQLSLGHFYIPGDQPGKPSGATCKPDFEAVYPVKTDLILADLPAGSGLLQTATEFNMAYKRFLQSLTEVFNGRPDLLLQAVPQMFSFRNMMNTLIRNPLPGSHFHAGPTFEI